MGKDRGGRYASSGEGRACSLEWLGSSSGADKRRRRETSSPVASSIKTSSPVAPAAIKRAGMLEEIGLAGVGRGRTAEDDDGFIVPVLDPVGRSIRPGLVVADDIFRLGEPGRALPRASGIDREATTATDDRPARWRRRPGRGSGCRVLRTRQRGVSTRSRSMRCRSPDGSSPSRGGVELIAPPLPIRRGAGLHCSRSGPPFGSAGAVRQRLRHRRGGCVQAR